MGFHFASAPLNFQRFLDLTRSGSRSLSPENEIRQMMVSSTSGSHINQGTLSSSSTAYPTDVSPDSLRQTSGNHLTGLTTSLKASSSSIEEDHFEEAEGSLLKYTTEVRQDYLRSHGLAEGEGLNGTDHEVMNELIEEFKTFSLWQYGSPFYYPVTDQFYCWNLHPLRLMYKHEYHDTEGICCDFCGYTEWLASTDEPEKNSGPLPEGPTSSRESCDVCKIEALITHVQHKSQGKDIKEEDTEPEKPKPYAAFYHCSVCRVDLCAACIADIRSDERYHAPYRQCLRCNACLSSQKAAVHRCRGSKSTARALSVKREEVEGSRMQGQAFSRGGVGCGVEEDLPSASVSRMLPKTGARKRAKTVSVTQTQSLADSPRAIQTSVLKKSELALLVSSPEDAHLIKVKCSSSSLEPQRWMRPQDDSTIDHSTVRPRPRGRPPGSRKTPPKLESGWEICITAGTSEEIALAEKIVKELFMHPVHQKVNTMQETLYVFKTSTRLAAENCARIARETGLLTSLRKF